MISWANPQKNYSVKWFNNREQQKKTISIKVNACGTISAYYH